MMGFWIISILCWRVTVASAHTFIVEPDTVQHLSVIEITADSAQAGDSLMLRDGVYFEGPINIRTGVVVFAEHPGAAEIYGSPIPMPEITLHGTGQLLGLYINGDITSQEQTLVDIQGGPAVIYNCRFRPLADHGTQLAFHCAGPPPFIRQNWFATVGSGSAVAENRDSSIIWMPYNYYGITDTSHIQLLIRDSSDGPPYQGHVYVSPILDSFEWLPAHDAHPALPKQFTLFCYPNPFNPSTIISFSLPRASAVELRVFDVTGRQVQTLTDERLEAGEHQVRFGGSELPSGIYFATLQAGGFVQTQKMVMVK